MKEVTIWHNPRCSKSREALALLEEKGITPKVYKYLDANPSKEDIKEILQKLGISARELMRTKESIYKELNLKEETDEEKLIEAMVAHPKLIERPIIITDNQAIIGRPPSKVLDIIT